MYNTWECDIVWVREMGLEVYVLVILTSLEAVNAHNVGEGTSGPKGNNLPWFSYEINE